jgi:hypothetical protein
MLMLLHYGSDVAYCIDHGLIQPAVVRSTKDMANEEK